MPERTRDPRRLPPTRFLVELTLLVGVLVTMLAATDDGRSYATLTPLSTPTSEVPLATASTPAQTALAITGTPSGIAPASTVPVPVAATPAAPVPTVERSPAGRTTPITTDAVAAPVTRARPLPAAVPNRLRIPSIGVDSTLMDLGLRADGTLEVPPNGFPAGWYTGAPTPGELGPAIIAGHVDWGGEPGVFFDLRGLAEGDEIAITRQDGSTAQFRVTRVERFAKDAFPTAAVYGDIDHAGLRLITCGGAFDAEARSYRDNLVVFAELVG